jgi:hypothetical protein
MAAIIYLQSCMKVGPLAYSTTLSQLQRLQNVEHKDYHWMERTWKESIWSTSTSGFFLGNSNKYRGVETVWKRIRQSCHQTSPNHTTRAARGVRLNQKIAYSYPSRGAFLLLTSLCPGVWHSVVWLIVTDVSGMGDAACSLYPEELATIYKTTRRHVPRQR